MKIGRKLLAFCMAACMMLCAPGCDLLEEPTESRSFAAMQPETEPSTEESTAPIVTEHETTEPLPTAPPETEPVQVYIRYPEAHIMSMYEDYAYSAGDGLSEKIACTDWASVPAFDDTAQMQQYLRDQFRACNPRIAVVVLRGCRMEESGFFEKETGMMHVEMEYLKLTHGAANARFVIYDVQYSTGALAVHAMETGDTSLMDARDLEAYAAAQQFVTEMLDTTASPLQQERQIHDYICEKTTYVEGGTDIQRESCRMATGVLLDGYANCMGYTDAFYMLAKMAGFTVETDSNADHTWNIITLDGQRYLVDVTWNDDALIKSDGTSVPQYRYFNCGLDIAAQEYEYTFNSLTARLAPQSDSHYFYMADEEGFGMWAQDTEEFYETVAQAVDNGETPVYMMGKGVEITSNDAFSDEILERISGYGSILTSYHVMGDMVFVYVEFENFWDAFIEETI